MRTRLLAGAMAAGAFLLGAWHSPAHHPDGVARPAVGTTTAGAVLADTPAPPGDTGWD